MSTATRVPIPSLIVPAEAPRHVEDVVPIDAMEAERASIIPVYFADLHSRFPWKLRLSGCVPLPAAALKSPDDDKVTGRFAKGSDGAELIVQLLAECLNEFFQVADVMLEEPPTLTSAEPSPLSLLAGFAARAPLSWGSLSGHPSAFRS